jgi:hypothetical protein
MLKATIPIISKAARIQFHQDKSGAGFSVNLQSAMLFISLFLQQKG